MNRMSVEMHEGGDGGGVMSVVLIVGWALYLAIAVSISQALKLSHKNSLRIWAFFNIAPFVFFVFVTKSSFLSSLGFSPILLFSYWLGGAVFEGIEKERSMIERIQNESIEKQDK